jgi:enoyl-CoA hydratase/carnithine racemase
MTYKTIIFEQRGPVALITLNRPEKLNAWTYEMRAELMDAMARVNNDGSIGAMVLTGAGRGFCAGADIGALFKKQIDRGPNEEEPESTSASWTKAVRDSKPMIAAVNGACIGVGLTQILSFDYIIASEQARFACAFVKMGVVTELGSSHFLVQRMGWGKASEAALTGRMIPASEAVQSGLADRLVAHDGLLDAALELAGLIAANPDRQLGMVKKLLTQNGSESDLDLIHQRETDALAICYKSAEHEEAVNAFLEKRPANFR